MYSLLERDRTLRYIDQLKATLKAHRVQVALPRVAALDARVSHRLLYETGVWHTEIELASNAQNSQQHIIVNKTFSVLQGVIEANQEPCESLRSAGRSRAEERVAEACA